MKRILVTGADGFIARHMISELRRREPLTLLGIGLSRLVPTWLADGEYRGADILDMASIGAVVSEFRPDAVFHLAGRMKGTDVDLYRTNFMGLVNILECIRRFASGARILTVGSAAEYGAVPAEEMPIAEDAPCRPGGAYGMSKYAGTIASIEARARWGARVVVVRPFNLIGPGCPAELLPGALIERIAASVSHPSRPPVRVGRTDTARDFVAVEDAVDCFIRAIESERWGEIFNVCSGTPTPINDLISHLLSCAPCHLDLVVDPGLVRKDDVVVSYGDPGKARKLLGRSPGNNWRIALTAAFEARLDTRACAS